MTHRTLARWPGVREDLDMPRIAPMLVGIAVSLATVAAGTAGAQPSPPAPPGGPPGATAPAAPMPYAPAPPTTKRYGTTIALVDGASVLAIAIGGVILVGEALDESDDGDGDEAIGAILLIGGAAGMFVGGPLVHLREGNRSGAWKSLGLRLGLPLLGAALGGAIDEGRQHPADETADSDLAGSLGTLGFVAAVVIDWAVLAEVEVAAPAPVMPYVAPARGGATIGIGGTF